MRWPPVPSSEWESSPPEKVSNRGGSEGAGLGGLYPSAAGTADETSDMLRWIFWEGLRRKSTQGEPRGVPEG